MDTLSSAASMKWDAWNLSILKLTACAEVFIELNNECSITQHRYSYSNNLTLKRHTESLISTKCHSKGTERESWLNSIMQIFWCYSQENFSYICHLLNSTCKKTKNFYSQLGCKVIDLLNFFYCVEQGWHQATQEGHFIWIKDSHQQWTETRVWTSNAQSLAKSRGTQRSYYRRGLFFLMNMFVNFYL